MIGEVYSLPIGSQDKSRPYIIVLQLKKTYIGVPAFSAGGYRANEEHATLRRCYQPPSDNYLFIELDNSKHIKCEGSFEGKQAYWEFFKFRHVDKKELRGKRRLGYMKPAGLALIIDGLLKFAQLAKGRFSPALLKKLKRVHRDLLNEKAEK